MVAGVPGPARGDVAVGAAVRVMAAGCLERSDQPDLSRDSPKPEPFVDPDTAAAFVGITRRALLQKVRAGKIPGYPLDRGAKKKEWRFKLSELDRYLCSAINSVLQPPEPANRRI